VSKYEWLLFLHVTGAFLFLGASVVAVVLNVAAQLRERPSEIALLLRLMSHAAVGVAGVLGLLLVLSFGLWLVDDVGYGYGDGWIVAALVLFVLSNALGGIGGQRGKPVRELAERLAAEGDAPSAKLRSMVRDPVLMLLNYGAGLLAFAVLALMIWKPGAGG
jgi:uncharacterized membrane protein